LQLRGQAALLGARGPATAGCLPDPSSSSNLDRKLRELWRALG